jgi:hypothetical protein
MVCGGERIATSGDGECVCVQYVYLDVYIDCMGGCEGHSGRGLSCNLGTRCGRAKAASRLGGGCGDGGDPGIGCGEPCCVLSPHVVSVSGGRQGQWTRG